MLTCYPIHIDSQGRRRERQASKSMQHTPSINQRQALLYMDLSVRAELENLYHPGIQVNIISLCTEGDSMVLLSNPVPGEQSACLFISHQFRYACVIDKKI